MLYFSASNRGFYDDTMHSTLPDDSVPISNETHAQLLSDQSRGLMIVAGADGAPVAVARPIPAPEQLWKDVRDRRDQLLRRSDFTQMPDLPMGEVLRTAWRSYRQALRDLPEAATDPSNIDWPLAPA